MSLSKIEKITLFLGLFNLAAVTISLIIAFWSFKQTRLIAEESGALDKGQLILSFGGYHVDSSSKIDIYIGYDPSKDDISSFKLPFGIHNHGNKTIDNVKMLYTYINANNIFKHNESNINYNLSNSFNERNYYQESFEEKVLYQFNLVNPDFEIEPGDILTVNRDSIKSSLFYLPLSIKVSAKDIKANESEFKLAFVQRDSLKSLIDFVSALKLSSSSADDNNTFIVMVPNHKENVGKGNKNNYCLSADYFNIVLCQIHKKERLTILFERTQKIIEGYKYQ